MRCISPVLVLRSVVLASVLMVAACGSDGPDDAAPSTSVEADGDSATTEATPDDTSDDSAAPDTTTIADDTTTTTEAQAEPSEDEVGDLCAAYLQSITIGTVDEGIAGLTEILGADAPSGVQDALDTLRDPDGDIEGFFAAQNSLDGYVLPICRGRFSTSIVPAADNAAAAEAFVTAVRDGDLAAAEKLAPTNVIVGFDWNGFPGATWDVDAAIGTVTMLLEPTVTVFCQLNNGAIEACVFGE